MINKRLTITSIIITLFVILNSIVVFADQFQPDASYTVCFSPQGNCAQKIVSAIKTAKHSIFVQAYTFTSYPIAKALIAKKNAAVEVKVIMDKNQFLDKQNNQTILYLAQHGVPIWLDTNLDGIAHNKVMIIDDTTVITGSFNFTKAANKYNAENVLIINDGNLAEKYKNNWLLRFNQAEKIPQINI